MTCFFFLPRKIVILIVIIHFNSTYDDSVSQYVSIVGSSKISESSDSEVMKLTFGDNACISHCVLQQSDEHTVLQRWTWKHIWN